MLPAHKEEAIAEANEIYRVILCLRIRACRACEEAVVEREDVKEADERRRRGVCVFAIVMREGYRI